MMVKRGITFVACAFALCLPASAAGAILSDRSVTDATLKVNSRGIALVEYTTTAGLRRHVLVWGALDGTPHPTEPPSTQARFQLDYSGGWKSRRNPNYWRTLRNACGPYDGPTLPFLITACKAPDGTYWALQAWQRNLPMRGFEPWTDWQRGVELHVSHWSGELPDVQLYRHWTYGHRLQGIFGRLMYRGQPVYGTKTPSSRVRDEWSRNVYIDTYNSDYGPGWRHDTAIATHRNGGFCYSFVRQKPPRGYPSDVPNGNGLGEHAPGARDRPRRDADRAGDDPEARASSTPTPSARRRDASTRSSAATSTARPSARARTISRRRAPAGRQGQGSLVRSRRVRTDCVLDARCARR